MNTIEITAAALAIREGFDPRRTRSPVTFACSVPVDVAERAARLALATSEAHVPVGEVDIYVEGNTDGRSLRVTWPTSNGRVEVISPLRGGPAAANIRTGSSGVQYLGA